MQCLEDCSLSSTFAQALSFEAVSQFHDHPPPAPLSTSSCAATLQRFYLNQDAISLSDLHRFCSSTFRSPVTQAWPASLQCRRKGPGGVSSLLSNALSSCSVGNIHAALRSPILPLEASLRRSRRSRPFEAAVETYDCVGAMTVAATPCVCASSICRKPSGNDSRHPHARAYLSYLRQARRSLGTPDSVIKVAARCVRRSQAFMFASSFSCGVCPCRWWADEVV